MGARSANITRQRRVNLTDQVKLTLPRSEAERHHLALTETR